MISPKAHSVLNIYYQCSFSYFVLLDIISCLIIDVNIRKLEARLD